MSKGKTGCKVCGGYGRQVFEGGHSVVCKCASPSEQDTVCPRCLKSVDGAHTCAPPDSPEVCPCVVAEKPVCGRKDCWHFGFNDSDCEHCHKTGKATECVCSETSGRNCPVHANTDAPEATRPNLTLIREAYRDATGEAESYACKAARYALYLEKRLAEVRRELDEHEELEAKLCPEDFGFEEVIDSLRSRLAEYEKPVTGDGATMVLEGLIDNLGQAVAGYYEKDEGVPLAAVHAAEKDIRDHFDRLRSQLKDAEREIIGLNNWRDVQIEKSRLSPSDDVKGLIGALRLSAIIDGQNGRTAASETTADYEQALSDAFASRDADIHDLRLLHSGALAGIASRDARIRELKREIEDFRADVAEAERINAETHAESLKRAQQKTAELASLKARVLTPEEAEHVARVIDGDTHIACTTCDSIRSKLTTPEDK